MPRSILFGIPMNKTSPIDPDGIFIMNNSHSKSLIERFAANPVATLHCCEDSQCSFPGTDIETLEKSLSSF